MNTNKLQSFAAESRTSLMKAVRARIDTAMEQNSAAQSDNPHAYQKLRDEIKQNGGGEQGRAKTAERHAYRWFNRIIALRYMDANEFTSVHVVSGEELDNPNALPQCYQRRSAVNSMKRYSTRTLAPKPRYCRLFKPFWMVANLATTRKVTHTVCCYEPIAITGIGSFRSCSMMPVPPTRY